MTIKLDPRFVCLPRFFVPSVKITFGRFPVESVPRARA